MTCGELSRSKSMKPVLSCFRQASIRLWLYANAETLARSRPRRPRNAHLRADRTSFPPWRRVPLCSQPSSLCHLARRHSLSPA